MKCLTWMNDAVTSGGSTERQVVLQIRVVRCETREGVFRSMYPLKGVSATPESVHFVQCALKKKKRLCPEPKTVHFVSRVLIYMLYQNVVCFVSYSLCVILKSDQTKTATLTPHTQHIIHTHTTDSHLISIFQSTYLKRGYTAPGDVHFALNTLKQMYVEPEWDHFVVCTKTYVFFYWNSAPFDINK